MTIAESAPRPGSILGTRVARTEDPALLIGAARYLADLPLHDRLHAVFVRSEIAHDPIEHAERQSFPAAESTTDQVLQAIDDRIAGYANVRGLSVRPEPGSLVGGSLSRRD